jgi:predicted deacetylase
LLAWTSDQGGGFGRFVAGAFGEVLQHGFTHQQDRPGFLSLCSGRSDEFAGLPRGEVRRRLGLGRELLRQSLGVEPSGFVAPAWQVGWATVGELGRYGFRYLATFGAIRATSGPTVPLATWSWDWGVLAPLGQFGQWLGDIHRRIRPAALPCVVVHPADVDRGYLPLALNVIDRLLELGRTPGLLSGFLG